jgi:hypothetical protein
MRRLLIALIAANAGLTSGAHAHDAAYEVWQAQQRAEAAFEALSARYTQIWASLSREDKARFSAQERAWLNEGRQQEQRACVAHVGTASEAVAAACLASVTERHLAALATPARVALTR